MKWSQCDESNVDHTVRLVGTPSSLKITRVCYVQFYPN